MNRYLLNISYIGTRFRGVQKTIIKTSDDGKTIFDKSTIQGVLELGLYGFRPVNQINVIPSSRTDTGVHALQSTVHVDLESQSGQPYDPNAITIKLNRSFTFHNVHIRVLSTKLVPNTFNCRFDTKLRKYLYRFAISNKDCKKSTQSHTEFIPIEEVDRCYFIHQSNFDIDKAQEAAQLFKGYHDFRSFMGISKQIKERDHPRYAWRLLNDCYIVPGAPALTTSPNQQRSEQQYTFYEIHVIGRSFLYRQVRRMVAIIIAVAQNRLTVKNVYEMLTIPSGKLWPSFVNTAPAHGLYLCSVEYDNIDDADSDIKQTDLKSKNKLEITKRK